MIVQDTFENGFSGYWISIEWYSELDEPAIVLWKFTSTSMSLIGRFYLRRFYGAKRTSIHRYAHNGAKWLRDFLFSFYSSLIFTPSLSFSTNVWLSVSVSLCLCVCGGKLVKKTECQESKYDFHATIFIAEIVTIRVNNNRPFWSIEESKQTNTLHPRRWQKNQKEMQFELRLKFRFGSVWIEKQEWQQLFKSNE